MAPASANVKPSQNCCWSPGPMSKVTPPRLLPESCGSPGRLSQVSESSPCAGQSLSLQSLRPHSHRRFLKCFCRISTLTANSPKLMGDSVYERSKSLQSICKSWPFQYTRGREHGKQASLSGWHMLHLSRYSILTHDTASPIRALGCDTVTACCSRGGTT